MTGDGSQTRSVCYVDDTIRGILALAATDHPGPVNIGSADEASVLELAHAVRSAAGSSAPIRFIDRPEDDPSVRRPSITLADHLLGWKAETALDDGLRRTIAWFRDQLAARELLPVAVGPDARVFPLLPEKDSHAAARPGRWADEPH